MLKVMYLMHQGLSLTQAVDYTVVVDEDIPPEHWANVRGVTDRAVMKSVNDAKAMLSGYDGGI